MAKIILNIKNKNGKSIVDVKIKGLNKKRENEYNTTSFLHRYITNFLKNMSFLKVSKKEEQIDDLIKTFIKK